MIFAQPPNRRLSPGPANGNGPAETSEQKGQRLVGEAKALMQLVDKRQTEIFDSILNSYHTPWRAFRKNAMRERAEKGILELNNSRKDIWTKYVDIFSLIHPNFKREAALERLFAEEYKNDFAFELASAMESERIYWKLKPYSLEDILTFPAMRYLYGNEDGKSNAPPKSEEKPTEAGKPKPEEEPKKAKPPKPNRLKPFLNSTISAMAAQAARLKNLKARSTSPKPEPVPDSKQAPKPKASAKPKPPSLKELKKERKRKLAEASTSATTLKQLAEANKGLIQERKELLAARDAGHPVDSSRIWELDSKLQEFDAASGRHKQATEDANRLKTTVSSAKRRHQTKFAAWGLAAGIATFLAFTFLYANPTEAKIQEKIQEFKKIVSAEKTKTEGAIAQAKETIRKAEEKSKFKSVNVIVEEYSRSNISSSTLEGIAASILGNNTGNNLLTPSNLASSFSQTQVNAMRTLVKWIAEDNGISQWDLLSIGQKITVSENRIKDAVAIWSGQSAAPSLQELYPESQSRQLAAVSSNLPPQSSGTTIAVGTSPPHSSGSTYGAPAQGSATAPSDTSAQTAPHNAPAASPSDTVSANTTSFSQSEITPATPDTAGAQDTLSTPEASGQTATASWRQRVVEMWHQMSDSLNWRQFVDFMAIEKNKLVPGDSAFYNQPEPSSSLQPSQDAASPASEQTALADSLLKEVQKIDPIQAENYRQMLELVQGSEITQEQIINAMKAKLKESSQAAPSEQDTLKADSSASDTSNHSFLPRDEVFASKSLPVIKNDWGQKPYFPKLHPMGCGCSVCSRAVFAFDATDRKKKAA